MVKFPQISIIFSYALWSMLESGIKFRIFNIKNE